MPSIKITCDTEAPIYQLSIYDYNFNLVANCPDNHSYEDSLDNGLYILAWRIFGNPHTKYKISFSGVSLPKKPVDRKIHNGEIASFGSKSFKVGN